MDKPRSVRDPVGSGEESRALDGERRPLALVAPDAELVARIRAGDHAAFEAVFRQYYAPLCDTADRYVQSEDVAQEVVQDVLCGLWAERAKLAVTTTLDRYLHGAVRNKSLNRLRHAMVEQRSAVLFAVSDEERLVEAAIDPSALPDERIERLAEAITRLPKRRREVLLLRWQRGLSYHEIATVMGSTVKAVELSLYRTLKVLRQLVASTK